MQGNQSQFSGEYVMLYYGQGTALVSRDEMLAKSSATAAFMASISEGGRPAPLAFSTGMMSADALFAAPSAVAAGSVGAFRDIGLGKPLTVQIREVYTGQYPSVSWFGTQKDMLVTSAIKSITTFDAKTRAINFLEQGIGAHTRRTRPAATAQGTPFVFYSPALLDSSLTLDLGMVFDTFPENLVTAIGNALQAAAGIPIFLAQGPLLLAAGAVVKLAAQAAEMIFDGKPSFAVAGEAIDINLPGTQAAQPGFRLITEDSVDRIAPNFRTEYQIDATGHLVNSANQPYAGDIPYMIISLDGTPSDQLTNFAPIAASANLLSRFYGINEGQSQPIDLILQAIKIYNDYTFRQQVDQIDARIAREADEGAKKALQDERSALLKNITLDLLRPAG